MTQSEFIPVNQPLLRGNEKKYLTECIDSGWISSEGPFVTLFEKKLAKRLGRKYGIAVSSGTAAIDVAIEALGIGKDDEVIMPAFTIISCINQIIKNGAIPVLVDSDPMTWNMDVSQIESKINNRTKAIMIVHIYGLPVDIDPIIGLAKKYNLKVIEDAAQMLGQTYNNKPCGSFGDISTFSFYPNKLVTTGEGGMILTSCDEIAENCYSLRNLCFQSEKRFVHERLGWNYRMTNLQAALGLAQLENLDSAINKKRDIGWLYTSLLHDILGVQLPLMQTEYANNIYWVYGVMVDEILGINAQIAMKRLIDKGIGTRPFFCPMHQQPILRRLGYFRGETYINAELMYRQGFYLPSGLALTNDQCERVAYSVQEILE